MSDLISRQAAIDEECKVCQIAPKKDRGHNCIYYVKGCKEVECLREVPSAQPEIIRCKDCKYNCKEEYEDEYMCSNLDRLVWDDWYCAEAERRTDE